MGPRSLYLFVQEKINCTQVAQKSKTPSLLDIGISRSIISFLRGALKPLTHIHKY